MSGLQQDQVGMSGRKRIYGQMLHYRNVAERRRFKITRWKLTTDEAVQLCRECSLSMNKDFMDLLEEIHAGTVKIIGIPVVLR